MTQQYNKTFKNILLICFSLSTSTLVAAETSLAPNNNWSATQEKQTDYSKQPAQTELEIGFGVGAIYLPHYLGSKENSSYALPLPYIRYSSEHLKADRKGVRGLLWHNDKFELSISSQISLPVDSGDNKLRQDMPDLNSLFEVGPSLNYEIFRSNDSTHSFDFQLPVRAAISIDGWNLSHEGWITSPQIEYQYFNAGWKINVNLGPSLADKKYHKYFYEIAPQYQTADRQAFDAKQGYTATRLSTSVSYRAKKWYFGAFFNYYNLNGAANKDSSLIETNNNFSAGLFVARVLSNKKY